MKGKAKRPVKRRGKNDGRGARKPPQNRREAKKKGKSYEMRGKGGKGRKGRTEKGREKGREKILGKKKAWR